MSGGGGGYMGTHRALRLDLLAAGLLAGNGGV